MRAGPSDPRAYFEEQLVDNDEFFTRFGREPDWRGKSVLDFGCGHGAMAIRAAERGADHVLGVDLDEERITWAQQNLADRYASLADRVSFVAADVAGVDSRFDLVISKDTFEHVADVLVTLRLLAARVERDGAVWIGFSPLFYSPWGDHRRLHLVVPWLHVLPWRVVARVASRRRGKPVHDLTDVGLNGLTPEEFRRDVTAAELRIDSIEYNRGDKLLLPALSLLRRATPLEKYTTVSLYAVLVPASR